MTSVLFLLTQFPEKSKGFMSEVFEGKLPTSQRAKRARMHSYNPSTTERQPSSATEQG